jgi:hypothetical protein
MAISLRHLTFGSRRRIIFTGKLVGLSAIAILVLLVFLLSGRSSIFRFDIASDEINFTTNANQVWGGAEVETRSGYPPICKKVYQLDIPEGVDVSVRRYETYSAVDLKGDKGDHVIKLRCKGGKNISSAFVSLPISRGEASSTASAKPLSEGGFLGGIDTLIDARRAQLTIPITGRNLRIGDGPDPNSPLSSSAILRSGTLSSETISFPKNSAIISTDYALHPGDIISFDPPSSPASHPAATSRPTSGDLSSAKLGAPSKQNGGAEFSGLLLIDADSTRIVGDTRSRAAYVTPPGSLRGAPRIVAPTLLARLEAQSEWGIYVVLGILLLNILAAFEKHLIEDKEEELFEWAKRRKPENISK